MNRSCLLFCCGNPLMDEICSTEVSESFLNKHNLERARAVIWPSNDLKTVMDDIDAPFEQTPGGSVLNTVRIFSSILEYDHLLDKHSIFFAGSIGDDKLGSTMEGMLDRLRVEHRMCKTDKDSTGRCGVFISDKERSLVASLGASCFFDSELLETESVLRFFHEAPAVYMSGFFLTDNWTSAQKLLSMAKEHSKKVCFNLASPFVISAFKDRVLEVIAATDILMGNEAEYAHLADVLEFTDKDAAGNIDLVAFGKFLASWRRDGTPRNVVVTQGPHPTIVVTDGVAHTYPVLAIPRDELIDTNGAGDSFAGGYLYGILLGHSEQRAIKIAHKLAKMVIKRSGVLTDIEDDDMMSDDE